MILLYCLRVRQVRCRVHKKHDGSLVLTLTWSLTHNARNKRSLTRICQPALWPVWREHPSGLGGLPWCPLAQCLDCHSTRWPGADLRKGTTLRRPAWCKVDMHERTWNAVLKTPSVEAEEADLHLSHRHRRHLPERTQSRGCWQNTYSSSSWRWGSSAGWWDQTSARSPWRPWRMLLSDCGTWKGKNSHLWSLGLLAIFCLRLFGNTSALPVLCLNRC